MCEGPVAVLQVVGVAQAINKKYGEDRAFTEQDEKVKASHSNTSC